MTILALEFSSNRRAVCVMRDGQVLSLVVHEETRQTPIFQLITRALGDAGVDRSEIGRLAVGLGPGSYTGIRLSISVAQGWQLGTGVETVGIGSLDTMAGTVEDPGEWLLAVDSQRNEYAVAEAMDGCLTGRVRLMGVGDLQERIAQGQMVAGPDDSLIGAGARPLYPDAGVLAKLAMSCPAVASESLTPVYLREASFAKAKMARTLEFQIPDQP